MEGYFEQNICGTSKMNDKGRLHIEALNISEFHRLLEKAEKEACQLNETLGRLRNFQFDIDFSINEPTSET